MISRATLLLLVALIFTPLLMVRAQFADPTPALNAVLADLSAQVGGRVTLDQLSHYSYVERMAADAAAACPAASVLYPTGSERAWSVSVTYHGKVYYYFAAQNGSRVVRCGGTDATQTPTRTPSPTPTATQTLAATLTPSLTFTPSLTYTPSITPSPTLTPTPMTCAGFMISRLYPGDQAQALPGNTLNLRAEPNANAPLIRKVYDTVVFTVIAGPVCDPTVGRAWWQVKYNNDIGWIIEGEGSAYFVTSLVTREPISATITPTPVPTLIQPTLPPTLTQPPTVTLTPSIPPPPTITPTVLACSNLLPARLTVGGHGRVTAGDPSNLRESPSSTGTRVRQIYHAVIFTVLNGPVCDEQGRRWWQIKYNDSIGWAAEGDNSSYFLEPAP